MFTMPSMTMMVSLFLFACLAARNSNVSSFTPPAVSTRVAMTTTHHHHHHHHHRVSSSLLLATGSAAKDDDAAADNYDDDKGGTTLEDWVLKQRKSLSKPSQEEWKETCNGNVPQSYKEDQTLKEWISTQRKR